jgi:hypothetical protein
MWKLENINENGGISEDCSTIRCPRPADLASRRGMANDGVRGIQAGVYIQSIARVQPTRHYMMTITRWWKQMQVRGFATGGVCERRAGMYCETGLLRPVQGEPVIDWRSGDSYASSPLGGLMNDDDSSGDHGWRAIVARYLAGRMVIEINGR